MIHFSKVKDGPVHCGAVLAEGDSVQHIGSVDLKVGNQVCTKCLGLFYDHSVPMAEVLATGTLSVTEKGRKITSGVIRGG